MGADGEDEEGVNTKATMDEGTKEDKETLSNPRRVRGEARVPLPTLPISNRLFSITETIADSSNKQ